MGGRQGKKKKKEHVQHAAIHGKNEAVAKILCQKDPERDNEAILKEMFHKPPDSKIAVWTLLVAVIVAGIYALQLIAMQDTVDKMQTQTRLSVRPWIGLDEGLNAIETTPLQIDATGNASLTYTIHAKNYSTSPASNVWSAANLVVADDLNTVYEQQDHACGDAMIGKPDIGLVLFQGRDRTFNSMPSLTKVSLKHEKGYVVGVWLAGCIGYRDQFGYLCRTKFIWQLRDEGGAIVSLQDPIPAMIIKGRFTATASGVAIDTCQIPKYK
jgi:hypothetical protein